MNGYEQMKNCFLAELNKALLNLAGDVTRTICDALDKAAYQFEITVKETAIVLREDPIPEVVKIYIAVKRTEGLSDGALENYARIFETILRVGK